VFKGDPESLMALLLKSRLRFTSVVYWVDIEKGKSKYRNRIRRRHVESEAKACMMGMRKRRVRGEAKVR
jgi:hypothetical protein